MAKKLKILHTVEHYLPFRCGMQEVVTRISEGLHELGHDVTVATGYNSSRKESVINGVKVIGFEITGNETNGYSWGEIQKYQEFILHNNFDIIVNFAAQQWATDLCYPLLDQIKCKKIIVPTGFSGLYWPEYEKYFQEMPEHLKLYDQIILHSEEYQDAHFIRKQNQLKYTVIPNGASRKEFMLPTIGIKKQLGIEEGNKVILLVGNHTGTKGHSEAIEMFARANISDATLVIVGKLDSFGCTSGCIKRKAIFNAFPFLRFKGGKFNILKKALLGIFDLSVIKAYLKNKRIIVTELEREKLISLFNESYIFLFPSQIECFPIVLMEARAAGLPIIVSNAGSMHDVVTSSNSGVVLPTHYQNGFSMVDVDQGARKIEMFFADPEYRNSLSTNAKSAFEEKYNWEHIVNRYESVYMQVCAR